MTIVDVLLMEGERRDLYWTTSGASKKELQRAGRIMDAPATRSEAAAMSKAADKARYGKYVGGGLGALAGALIGRRLRGTRLATGIGAAAGGLIGAHAGHSINRAGRAGAEQQRIIGRRLRKAGYETMAQDFA